MKTPMSLYTSRSGLPSVVTMPTIFSMMLMMIWTMLTRTICASVEPPPLPHANDLRVNGLDKIEHYHAFADFDGQMYAGTLPSNNGNRTGEMMFWLFEPTHQTLQESMILWLNGGPGCSSFNCGVLMEISPVTQPQHPAGYCCLDSQPHFSYNNYTWTKATTILFVEQPIGTGFSHGDFPQDEHDVSTDIYAFMQNFYRVFPHLQNYDFFVTGESYAGMFIPSIARWFNLENKVAINDSSRIVIPLKGASLGNGWIDAQIQGPAVIDFSWWHGLIDQPTRDALHTEWDNCMLVWNGQVTDTVDTAPQPPFHNFNVQDDCALMWGVLQASGYPNAYDVTTWDPNVDQVTFASEVFYNNAEVKTALNAPEDIVWHGCRQGGGRRRLSELMSLHRRRLYMDNDRPLSVVPYIADLVDDGIPVLVYNGDRDMTTNMVGTELALNQMEWSSKEEWPDASRGLWMVDGKQAGWSKEHGNLKFLTVYNSGHMVPYNVPGPALDMITRVITNKSFIDSELPAIRVKPIVNMKESSNSMDLLTSVVGDPSYNVLTLIPGEHMRTVGVAAISMMVGFGAALFVIRRSRGYVRVPNTFITV